MSTAFTFLTVYTTINKQHLKIYHEIDGKSPQKELNQKKIVAHFSALQIAHKSSGREKGRQRKRQSKSTRAFLTSLFRKNRTKSTSRKKNKHNKEEESSREGRTSRKIQKKNEKNTASLSTTRHASRRVGSAEVSAQVRGRATALLALLALSTVSSVSIRIPSPPEMLVLLRP